jgi:octanoyl-[GcvH]:protein N-octanoyltransferase
MANGSRCTAAWSGHDGLVRLVQGSTGDADPAVELAVSMALVRQASRGEVDETLRVYHPRTAVVAFGRRDTHRPGFTQAVRRARGAGFEPLVRSVGGRAAAYTEAALVLDVVGRATDSTIGMDARFRGFGDGYARALRSLGIDARVGAVPGEYCPGAQSVNARDVVKLIGTAQRVVRGAWLFSALVVVSDHEPLRPVLGDVYRLLGQPFDERSVGSVIGEAPAVGPARVEEALVNTHTHGRALEHAELDASTWDLARELAADHRA